MSNHTENVVPADAALLRSTADTMGPKLKTLLTPYGARSEGWDDWMARLRALADALEKITPGHVQLLRDAADSIRADTALWKSGVDNAALRSLADQLATLLPPE
jgi:hypothetical protein